jgi:hypothetical protein
MAGGIGGGGGYLGRPPNFTRTAADIEGQLSQIDSDLHGSLRSLDLLHMGLKILVWV